MEPVGSKRVCDGRLSGRRIDIDIAIVQERGHGGIESPVPVWNTKGDSSLLILAPGRVWVASSYALRVLPYDLLHESSAPRPTEGDS